MCGLEEFDLVGCCATNKNIDSLDVVVWLFAVDLEVKKREVILCSMCSLCGKCLSFSYLFFQYYYVVVAMVERSFPRFVVLLFKFGCLVYKVFLLFFSYCK